MTKQASHKPYAAAVNTKFANTMDGRRPLASQDPNTSNVAAVAGVVGSGPPWKPPPTALEALHFLGAPVGPGSSSGGGPGAPGASPGPSIGSTGADGAMVPAQQAQPYPRHDRNGGRPAAHHQHQDRNHQRRRRPSRSHPGGSGSMTLRYVHDQTTNIHDRLSGCQPGAPPDVEEWEETMRLRLDRLTEIIHHPRPPSASGSEYGYPYDDAYRYVDANGYPYYYSH